MKPRRVIVTLEMTTVLTLNLLQDRLEWHWVVQKLGDVDSVVHQVQCNVVREQPKRRKKAKP